MSTNEPIKESGPIMPELDGIRGLAILGVLCTHGAKLTGLFSSTSDSFPEKLFMYTMVPLWGGVDLFFVLSGFLITGILLRTKANANYFSSFYARRVLRIFPIYYLVLVLCVIAGHYSATIESFLPPSASWKFSYFIYLQNWPIFWHGEKMMAGIWGAYWSLAVEEQFYFVWPLVVFLFSTKTVTRIALIGVACALPLRILLCHVYFKGEIGLAQMTSSRIDGLFLGAACAVYMFEYKRPVPMRWIVAAASVGAAIMGFITVFHHNELVATWTWMTTIGISGFALLSVALVAISQYHFPLLQRALTFRWLRLLGKYSYGIYVYHLMIFLWLGNLLAHPATAYLRATLAGRILLMLIGMAAAFLVAKISYDLYESRFLRLKKYFNPA